MITRDEIPADIPAIDAVVTAAFRTHPFSNQRESDLVRLLRVSGGLVLSRVAVDEDDAVIGHLAASPASIGAAEGWILFGPLAVTPPHQRTGIGTALMIDALVQLKQAGAPGIVLVGAPDYYGRFGFRPLPGVTLAGIPAGNVLVCPFTDPLPSGNVALHPAFVAVMG